MSCLRILSFFNALLLSTNVIATTATSSSFSPYVDLTLNTHWDPQTQQMEPMDLVIPSKTEGIKSYHLAFITDSGQCQPAWGGQQSYDVEKQWGKNLTDQLFMNGVELKVSFGGANGNDISLHCDKSQLVNTFNQVIKTYHATTLDFDIENGSADVTKLLDAIREFQQQQPKIKVSFTLPVLPEGLVAQGKDLVSRAQQAGIHFIVNIMAMDYGPAYSGDMGEYAMEAATNLHQFLQTLYSEKKEAELWQLVEVTPMIGVNDVSTEQFTLSNADKLKEFAMQKQIAGLSMWSLTRDKPCADKWASPICSGNNLQTREYEFTAHFQ